MLEAHSPLVDITVFEKNGIAIFEAPDFKLTQVAGFGKAFEKDLTTSVGKLPSKIGVTLSHGPYTVMRVAPQQFWIIGAAELSELPASCLVTPLSSARCRIAVSGPQARSLLSRCAAIDFDAAAFAVGQFAMTGIHHTPVLVHCVEQEIFHIYALRTFALNVWEWLIDTAEELEQ